ncbi:MAG: hypothetical protein AAGA53_05745 [Pseudomonadota bacterium]
MLNFESLIPNVDLGNRFASSAGTLFKFAGVAVPMLIVAGILLPPLFVSQGLAEDANEVQTTEDAVVHAGPGNGFDRLSVLEPGVQVTIISPSSVVIGEGVSIGQGVLIEGKPWINVRLPDGRSGYVLGSALCTKTENASVRVALCSP